MLAYRSLGETEEAFSIRRNIDMYVSGRIEVAEFERLIESALRFYDTHDPETPFTATVACWMCGATDVTLSHLFDGSYYCTPCYDARNANRRRRRLGHPPRPG